MAKIQLSRIKNKEILVGHYNASEGRIVLPTRVSLEDWSNPDLKDTDLVLQEKANTKMSLPPTFEINQVVKIAGSEYTVTGKLGKGGYGEVYKIKNIASGQEFAAKVSRSLEDLTSNTNEMNIFLVMRRWCLDSNENRLLPCLRSYEIYQKDVQVLVMDLVGGENMETVFRGGAVPGMGDRNFVQLLRRICAPLIQLQGLGISSGDVKPNNFNIFLSENRTDVCKVMLLDFGLSCSTYTMRHFPNQCPTRYDDLDGAPHIAEEFKIGAGNVFLGDVYSLGFTFNYLNRMQSGELSQALQEKN